MMARRLQTDQGLTDVDRSGFLSELADFYRGRGYEVVAQNRDFPPESPEQIGVVDLLLQDTLSHDYKVVETTKTGELDPRVLAGYVRKNERQAAKARDYFGSELDSGIDTEVVLGTEADLNTVRELLENTKGQFTWNQALRAVSNSGRLANIRDDGHLVMNYEISREENEEYLEFSSDLEATASILQDCTTYP